MVNRGILVCACVVLLAAPGTGAAARAELTTDQKLLAVWGKEHLKYVKLAAKQTRLLADARTSIAAGKEVSPELKVKFEAATDEMESFVPKSRKKMQAARHGTKDGKRLKQLAIGFLSVVPAQSKCMEIYFSVRSLEDVFKKWLKCIGPVNKALVEYEKAIAAVGAMIAVQKAP